MSRDLNFTYIYAGKAIEHDSPAHLLRDGNSSLAT